MKNIWLIFIFIWLGTLFRLSVVAQEVVFQHLTTDDGLSHNSITSIYQDERGFMWFGSRNGVNLYNGRQFKIYKKEKNNPNSILYNDIYHITGDHNGHIYIMNNRGVSSYNIWKDSFQTVVQQNIRAMYYDKRLYMATSRSIFTYDGKQIVHFYTLPDTTNCFISRLHVWNDSVMVGTDKGIFLLTSCNDLKRLIYKGNTSDILRTRDGEYWITMASGQGTYCIRRDGTLINFRHSPDDPHSISSDFAQRCCEDSTGSVWIGTFNGLNKYNREQNCFTRYLKREGLNYPSVWGLYCDSQGTIWAGTYSEGINYFHPQIQLYKEYKASLNENDGLSSPIVGRMIEDDEGCLWICTERGGLNRYDPVTQTYRWYKTYEGNDNVRAIYYDKQRKVMWLGIHLKGLYKLDLKSGRFTQYKHDSSNDRSLPSNQVEDIVPYGEKLLLATSNGVTLFDPVTEKFNPLFHEQKLLHNTNSTFGLIFDHTGVLWTINNNNGVCAYHVKTQNFSIYKHRWDDPNSLSSNSINAIYEDSQHRLWFCTNENGLDLYRNESDDFENFDMQKNGLASNIVYNICELSPDRLLVTTDKGVSVLDYRTRKFENYVQFPLSCINENALYKAHNGEIFIGGTTGIISFMPENLKSIHRPFRIYPYRLIVNGKEVEVGDESGILRQNLTYVSEITLQADQNVFHIEYATTDYIPYHKNEILYKLEGFSKQWNRLEQDAITYTNLNPGQYTLIVKASDVDETLAPPNKIQIEVLPPFYRTPMAYLLYLVCITLVLWYVVSTYYSRIKLQESLKYEKQHAVDIEQLNQAKLRFFTNISHEFRTPLTLIIGQMEMLLQIRSFPAQIYNKILSAYRNSLQLRVLITELLDFRKQEQGYVTLHVSEHNIVNFVYRHYQSFYEYAIQNQIAFHFVKSSDDIRVWYDTKQMQKAMNNLISNAFKHTSKGSMVAVMVKKWDEEVIIEVTDSGTGIAETDIDKIFDRFYSTEKDSLFDVGNGIGLALTKSIVEMHHGTIKVHSEVGAGSTFSIHLKLGNKHFTAEQLCETGKTEDDQLPDENPLRFIPLTVEAEKTEEMTPLDEKKYKILIVEDNDSLRKMLETIFYPFYTVLTASDGAEGLEKVYDEQPHIVLSDISVPKISGISLCRTLKQNLDTCHIPVVLLTAQATVEHSQEGLHAGADDYIVKPFNVHNLLARCNNLVNNRILLQEKYSKQPKEHVQILATSYENQKFVNKVIEIIENEMGNGNFSVNQLVARMGLSRSRLFHQLKDITGKTPSNFILDIRLRKAAYLLKNCPNMNISEVADSIGFSCSKRFSRHFKEKYHLSPRDYKNEMKEAVQAETDTPSPPPPVL